MSVSCVPASPGGTPAGEAIRAVLLGKDFEGLSDKAEALLFAASRGDHVDQVIRPQLEQGAIVVCDRYLDSSVAYQGYGRELGVERVRDLSLWATGGLLPDMTIVLDIDPSIGLSRVQAPDRLESEPVEYHRRVRQAFLDIASADPEKYLVIDASEAADVIAARISERVSELMERSR